MKRLHLKRRWVAACGLLLFLLGTAAPANGQAKADKGKGQDEPATSAVFDVDPEGQPSSYGGAPRGATYYLWREGDTWRLRTRTREDSHRFAGTIYVQGGKVTKISNYQGLEPRGKKKKARDVGRLNDNRTRIDFEFRTAGREDGFDFQVSESATGIGFDLRVMGYEHPERIIVGSKGLNPPAARFSLPAHAPKQP